MRNIFVLAFFVSLLGACSTANRVARLNEQKDYNDDVYFSDISAKEEIIIAKNAKLPEENTIRSDEGLVGGHMYGNYLYDGDSYADRIRRFYYFDSPFFSNSLYSLNPWFNEYGFNNWGFNNFGFNNFGFNNFGFNNFNNWLSPGSSLFLGLNPWAARYSAPFWMYGYPYSNRFWGPVSYNNFFPGYGYGFIGNRGGLFNARPNLQDPNYRARPIRGAENIGGIPLMGTTRTDGQGRVLSSPSRGETNERAISGGNSGRASSTAPAQDRARPARTENTRPTLIDRETPSRTSIQSEPRQTFPSSSGSEGGGSSGSGGGESRGRPSRAVN